MSAPIWVNFSSILVKLNEIDSLGIEFPAADTEYPEITAFSNVYVVKGSSRPVDTTSILTCLASNFETDQPKSSIEELSMALDTWISLTFGCPASREVAAPSGLLRLRPTPN